MIEPRSCGRPTKSGAPCRNNLQPGRAACPLHATPTEKLLAEHDWTWHHEGHQAGNEAGRAVEESGITDPGHLREEQERARFRERDAYGQLVVVDRGRALTYRWCGDGALSVGDRVLVPGNWLYPTSEVCTVTAIGSSFEGDIQNIIRRITS